MKGAKVGLIHASGSTAVGTLARPPRPTFLALRSRPVWLTLPRADRTTSSLLSQTVRALLQQRQMGRGRGRGRGGAGGAGGGGRKNGDRSQRWSDVPTTNDNFIKYYKQQGIVPDDEWDQFIQALHDPLPTTFRITSCREYVALSPPLACRGHQG